MSDNVSLPHHQICWSGPGQYSTDLKECARKYVETRYSNLNGPDPETYFVPGFVLPKYTGSIDGDGAPTDGKSREEIDAAIRGFNSEQKVLGFLREFTRLYPQPMVVFSGFQYNKLLAWLGVFEEDKPYLASIERKSQEIDILIIHRSLGLVVFEVKSKKKTTEACKQVKAIETLLRACHFFSPALKNRPPTLNLAHFNPNEDLTSYGRDHGNNCSAHLLDQTYLGNQQKFLEWLESLDVQDLVAKSNNGFAYETIVSSLICSHSVVDAYEDVANDVIRQECLKLTARKRQRATAEAKLSHRSASASNSTGETLSKVLKFLNPDQHSVWSGPKWQLITGPFGSGKTILIRHKALQLLKQGENVLVITTYPISLEYKKFFKNNESAFHNSPIWKIVYFSAAGNHGDQKGDDARHELLDLDKLEEIIRQQNQKGSFNVFIDEVQGGRALPFRNSGKRYSFSTRLTELDEMLRRHNPVFYWIAVDLINHAMLDETIRQTDQVTDVAPRRHHRSQIKQCMRCTKPLYQFCFSTRSFFEDYVKNGHQYLEKSIVQQIKNEDAHLVSLGHNVEGPPFVHIQMPTLIEAAKEAVRKVEELVSLKQLKACHAVCAKKPRDKAPRHCVYDPMKTLLVFILMKADTKDILYLVQWTMDSLKQRGIPTCHLADYARCGGNAITVGCGACEYDFYSFEWHTVIMVADPSYLLDTLVVPTRAILQLIWIECKTMEWNYPEDDEHIQVDKLRQQETRYFEHTLRLGLLENNIGCQNPMIDWSTCPLLPFDLNQMNDSTLSRKNAEDILDTILEQFLLRQDDQIIPTLSYILAYFATYGPDLIEIMIDSGFLLLFVPLLVHKSAPVQAATLLWMGIMTILGSEQQTKYILDLGILDYVADLLRHSDKWIQKLSLWCLGNIASNRVDGWDTPPDNSFVKSLYEIFEEDGFQLEPTEELAGWALSFMTINNKSRLRVILDGQNTLLRDIDERMISIMKSCHGNRDLLIQKTKEAEAEEISAIGRRLCAIIDQKTGLKLTVGWFSLPGPLYLFISEGDTPDEIVVRQRVFHNGIFMENPPVLVPVPLQILLPTNEQQQMSITLSKSEEIIQIGPHREYLLDPDLHTVSIKIYPAKQYLYMLKNRHNLSETSFLNEERLATFIEHICIGWTKNAFSDEDKADLEEVPSIIGKLAAEYNISLCAQL